MHHSAAVVQNSIAAAIQNARGSRPPAPASGAGGVAIVTRRLLAHSSAGSASEASSATRQPAPVTAASESAPISTT